MVSAGADRPTVPSGGGRGRLLLVEDHPATAALVRGALERVGFAVRAVGTGREALAAAPGADLVLLDLGLPDRDGLEVCRRLRADPLSAHVPLIILSARDDATSRVRGLRDGADDYVTKPFDLEELVARIDLHLRAHRAEAVLRASEAKYRLLFNAAPEPIWVIDPRTDRFLEVNEAAIARYGYSRAEFLAMTIRDIRPPEDRALLRQAKRRFVQGQPVPVVWRHRTKDGAIIWVELAWHRIEFAGREARLVIVRDITERRRLEEQLRQAQKMEAVGRLAGGIAHDFNNLMTVVAGYSELLLSHPALDPALRAGLDEIRKAGDHAAELTRQLLAFGRKQVLQPKVLDLNTVVAETENMLRRLIGEDIVLVTQLDPALGRVRVDPGQLTQVLVNLAVNARDAMPDGGRLTLATAQVDLDTASPDTPPELPAGRYARLTIRDTGTGMDAETRAHLFEPFFTTKGPGRGTGLGLAMVYGIVKQSGGDIEVESTPGQGSAFHIYLPLHREEARPAGPERKAGRLPAGTETVLLVEDEDGVRALTREVLVGCGYTVLSAAHGDEALAAAERHQGPLDLLITDVVLPGLSGPALAERLLQQRPGLRVLFTSGYADEEVLRRGAAWRGTDFLPKPYAATTLARKVRRVLDAPGGRPARG